MEKEYKTPLILRQRVHKYALTEKGRLASRKSSLKYNHSPKGKERNSLYHKTQSYKDNQHRYYIKRKDKTTEI
jgi:hypothetical protein